MAAIEKICEFSGEYPGFIMRRYKHNLIQVMPEHRKRFAKAEHVLHIFQPELTWLSKSGMLSESYNPGMMAAYDPPYKCEKEFQADFAREHQYRLVKDYDYCLVVSDPNLAGRVEGFYLNWTMDLSATKRKLKRMLKCRKLNIQVHACSYSVWRYGDTVQLK